MLVSGTFPSVLGVTAVEDAVALSLERVGPRLQALRARFGLTLADVTELTGISTSTLSRLETGQRKPSLEVLLPLASVYRIPLDELVGAPETGDPRVRLRPSRINGRTVIPLTRAPGATSHAWKIVIPASFSLPVMKAHEGSEWIYVLSGRMRLILGEQDMILEAGEVAEFHTRTPHWFGSDGEHEAEILSIFGPQGEHMHTRAER